MHRAFGAKRGLEVAASLTAVVSLITGVLIARTLGPYGRGQVVSIATWGQAVAWVAGLSIDKALIARESRDGRRQTSMPLAAGLSIMMLMGTGAAVVSFVASQGMLGAPRWRLGLAMAVLGTLACDARAADLLSRQKWRDYAVLRFAQPVIYLVGCLGAAALVRTTSGDATFLVVTALCASLWAPALLVGGWPRVRFSLPGRKDVGAMFLFAGGYHVGNLLSFLTARMDFMVVSARFGAAPAGIYSVAVSLGQFVTLFGSINLVRGIAGKIKPSHVDRGGLIAAGAVTAGIAVCGTWILDSVYGAEFAAAGKLARIVCVGGLLLYLRQGFNGQLTGLGRPWATAWVNGVGAVAFVALVPLAHGMSQVATVSVVALALSTTLSYGLVRRHGRQPVEPGADPAGDVLTSREAVDRARTDGTAASAWTGRTFSAGER